MKITLALMITLVFLTGCVNHQYFTPRPDTHPLDPIENEFTSVSPLALANAQADESDHIFLSSGLARFHANYHDWTDVALQVLQRELVEREATISDTSDKKIELSIIEVSAFVGFVKTETEVILNVTLSNGYEGTYSGRNNNVMGAVNQRQIDGAIMRSVAAMLNDPEIVKFISE